MLALLYHIPSRPCKAAAARESWQKFGSWGWNLASFLPISPTERTVRGILSQTADHSKRFSIFYRLSCGVCGKQNAPSPNRRRQRLSYEPWRRPSQGEAMPVARRGDSSRKARRRPSQDEATPVARRGDSSRESRRRPSRQQTAKRPKWSGTYTARGGSCEARALTAATAGSDFFICGDIAHANAPKAGFPRIRGRLDLNLE